MQSLHGPHAESWATWSRRPASAKLRSQQEIARGWLRKHESGTYVKFTQASADVFA